jgi:peptidyl-tRNA hydrolase
VSPAKILITSSRSASEAFSRTEDDARTAKATLREEQSGHGVHDSAHGDPYEHNANCSYRMFGFINGPMAHWATHSFKKIVLSVASDDDLVRVYQLAIDAGLPAAMMTDNGETEFHGVFTRTAVAIGPYYSTDLDKITGAGGLVSTKLI